MEGIIASDEHLYRGLHKLWIEDDNSVSSAAFKDSGGVSVDRDGGREENECVDRMVNALSKIEGVGKMSCRDVESCDAVVEYNPTNDNEYHSLVKDSADQLVIKSKSKARKLASKCKIVYKKCTP